MTTLKTSLLLAALAVIVGGTISTDAHAISNAPQTYPVVQDYGVMRPSGHGALREWQNETVHNNRMRQAMLLPSAEDKTAAGDVSTQTSDLRQWQEETVANNAMRNRMMLSQQ